MEGCITDLNDQAAKQALPTTLSQELRALLVCSTHRVPRTRDIAAKFLNRLIVSFPSLMCDQPFVFAILEVLTLLHQACLNEFVDEASDAGVVGQTYTELIFIGQSAICMAI